MKPEDILNALGDVEDKYIEEAALSESSDKKEKKARVVPRILLRWGTVAACIVIAVTLAVPIISKINHLNAVSSNKVPKDKNGVESYDLFDVRSWWTNWFSSLHWEAGGMKDSDGKTEQEEPASLPVFSFNSVLELYLTLNSTSSEANRRLNSIIASDEGQIFGMDFNSTIAAFENNEIRLFVPYINGNQIKLREKSGFYPITLLPSELYGLPWIWYHCDYSGNDISICIAYPSVVYGDKIKDVRTCSGLLDIIAPSGPNVSTAEKYKDSYPAIYSDNVRLCDGTETEAVFYETSSGEKYAMMYYKDVITLLRADKSFPFDDLLASFSLEAE